MGCVGWWIVGFYDLEIMRCDDSVIVGFNDSMIL